MWDALALLWLVIASAVILLGGVRLLDWAIDETPRDSLLAPVVVIGSLFLGAAIMGVVFAALIGAL